jgi:hypothetical protein
VELGTPIELEGREVVAAGSGVGLSEFGGTTLPLGTVLGQGAVALVGGNIGAVVAASGGFHGLAGAGG